jgi:hypothetical protein
MPQYTPTQHNNKEEKKAKKSILYSILYREYINIFISLVSFFYPPPIICEPPLAWPVFHNIAAFVLSLYSTYEREHATFGLLSLANFTKVDVL